MARKQPEFRRSVLKNGMVLVSEELKHFESISIGVWVRRGSRSESKKEFGLAHFLEHMMFKGTKNRSARQIALSVDAVGGDFNAMTSREYTCYHISLPARESRFAIELLTDILQFSEFHSEEIESERQVILQEIAMLDDNPEEMIYDYLFEKAYGEHPLARNIIGTKKNVKSFKRKDIIKFFQTHYKSDNIVISYAGNYAHKEMKRQLNELLKDYKGKTKKEYKESRKKPKFQPGLYVKKRDLEQTHLVLAYESFPIEHPLRVASYVLNIYLGGWMSSRLFQRIREEKGLAYSVYSSLAPHRDCGLLSLYVATHSRHIAECLQMMREEVMQLQRRAISEIELERVKSGVKNSVLMSSDSVEARMESLAKSEIFFSQHLSKDKICNLVDKVTVQQVWDVALEIFSNPPLLVALGEIKKAQLKNFFLFPKRRIL